MITTASIKIYALAGFMLFICQPSWSVASKVVRETAEFIFEKFGKGVAGNSIEELAEATSKIVARHGEIALPFLRQAGPDGIKALDEAGEGASRILNLYARKGNDAIRLVSDPLKRGLFLKHGDTAADALIKHPGIAESLIESFGDDAAHALTSVSRGNAQKLNMLVRDGFVKTNSKSAELLPVVRKYGDEAMNFIWKNKGALAVSAVMLTFISEPEAYISGAKDIGVEAVGGVDWTPIVSFLLLVAFLPFIVRSFKKGIRAARAKR